MTGFRDYVAGDGSTLTGAAVDIAAALDRRFRWCALEGQDAVEPDDLDGYTNKSDTGVPGGGWHLTRADSAGFERWLAYMRPCRSARRPSKNDPANARATPRVSTGWCWRSATTTATLVRRVQGGTRRRSCTPASRSSTPSTPRTVRGGDVLRRRHRSRDHRRAVRRRPGGNTTGRARRSVIARGPGAAANRARIDAHRFSIGRYIVGVRSAELASPLTTFMRTARLGTSARRPAASGLRDPRLEDTTNAGSGEGERGPADARRVRGGRCHGGAGDSGVSLVDRSTTRLRLIRVAGIDLLVLGDCNPDLILSGEDVVPAFGQAERLAETAELTVGGSGAIMACGARDSGCARRSPASSATTFSGASSSRPCASAASIRAGCTSTPSSGRSHGDPGRGRTGRCSPSRGDRGAEHRGRRRRLARRGPARARRVVLPPDSALPPARLRCWPARDGAAHRPRSTPTGTRASTGTAACSHCSARSTCCSPTPSRRAGSPECTMPAGRPRHSAARGPLVAVELGPAGGLAARPGREPVLAPAPAAGEPVDTVGAGDSFDAGLVTALLAGRSDADTLASVRLRGAVDAISRGTAAQPSLEEALAALGAGWRR